MLIAFSDTGGGHRAAARHLQAALERADPSMEVQLADPYALSQRWPFDRLQAAYPKVVGQASWLWRAGFRLSNTRPFTAIAQALAWPVLRSTFVALRAEYHPDVILSTHPLLASPLRRAFRDVPIVVVVTDLVSGHVSWYHPSASLVVTPTEAATAQALSLGVPRARVVEIGLPVGAECVVQPGDRPALARDLGWSMTRPTLLLVGGGDGVGPLEAIARAVDAASLPCDLAIVTGRNASLAERLRAHSWHGTVHVYGFVHHLGAMMRAAHATVTKAGPGTICEAFAAGCPLVLFGAIPGQEEGNVQLVETSGAGVWAPSPQRVTEALRQWFTTAEPSMAWHRAAAAARRAARPHAADEIAGRVMQLATAAPPAARVPSSPVS